MKVEIKLNKDEVRELVKEYITKKTGIKFNSDDIQIDVGTFKGYKVWFDVDGQAP